MSVLFATKNNFKFQEIESVLEEFDIVLERAEIDFAEPNEVSIKKVVIEKARQAFTMFKQPLFVEDTGFFFEAYKDFPGTISKRMFESIGFEGLLQLLKGKSRKAYTKTVICFIESRNDFQLFEGTLYGKITSKIIKPKANTMPYEKIFIPDGHKKALAELSRKEKNSFSHRAIAARKLGKWLKEKDLGLLLDSIE